jgi:phenylalanyl-tRNA synthetase beta chain
MLDMGQPMHAFDADYIRQGAAIAKMDIRKAKPGESVTTLSGDTYQLGDDMYVISNGATGEALDIAGVKGGLHSGVQPTTKNIVLSVGTYDGELVRKTCQRLSIHTDASQRYQNRPSPELGAYGMRAIVALITEIAGGTLRGGVDIYTAPPLQREVSVTAEKVSRVLGAVYTDNDVEAVLTRLDLPFRKDGSIFTVTPPFERTDIVITEDLIEEVGRVIGYDRVVPALLSTSKPTQLPPYFSLVETIRDTAAAAGCIEVSTYAMGSTGDVALQKPLASDKKFLRSSLVEGHTMALETNAAHMPLYNLADLRLFEIGRVWRKGEEVAVLGISYWSPTKDHIKKRDAFFASIAAELSAVTGLVLQGVVEKNTWQVDLPYDPAVASREAESLPESTLSPFKAFSSYPYALRDIAVWTPEGTDPTVVHALIQRIAGDILVRSDLHDVFTKDGRTSCMFKLVLQAFDRTLTDVELSTTMARITDALNAQTGFSVR